MVDFEGKIYIIISLYRVLLCVDIIVSRALWLHPAKSSPHMTAFTHWRDQLNTGPSNMYTGYKMPINNECVVENSFKNQSLNVIAPFKLNTSFYQTIFPVQLFMK